MDKETTEYKKTDNEYKEYALINAKDSKDGWDLETDSGWHLFVNKIDNHVPKPGHVVRFYGKGIGFAVRGIDIDNVNYYYLTPDQSEAGHKKWCENLDKERRESYAKNKDKYKEEYEALPKAFKERMDRLIEESPDKRHEWEPYEIYILTESVKILNALKTPEAIESFHNENFYTQKTLVPDLDEGHSGNTFGCATRFAYQIANGMTDI